MVTTTKVNLGIECPFCGSKPLLECTEVYEDPRDTLHWVKCEVCGATSGGFNNLPSARQAWTHVARLVAIGTRVQEIMKEE